MISGDPIASWLSPQLEVSRWISRPGRKGNFIRQVLKGIEMRE